jgi:non-ribosomal peptide synthetase component F
LEVGLGYMTSALSKWQARNIANAIKNTMVAILQRPDATVENLELVGNRDISQIMRWNSTPIIPIEQTLHSMIAKTTVRRMHFPAIVSREGSFTYGELDSLSTIMAHHLAGLGVRTEVLVGVCFEKSAWAIVAMLAIIKAGGAFVPLDPGAPKSRLHTIIETASVDLVLASSKTAKLAYGVVERVVIVSKIMIQRLPQITSSVQTSVTPANKAYAIFTSGSTGTPKGVVVEHRAISSSLTNLIDYFGFHSGSRVLQYGVYIFDIILLEIFGTLMSGGCICVFSDEERFQMPRVIHELNVNTAFFTPSVLRLISPDDIPSLQLLLVGGEALDADIVQVWGQSHST